VERSIQERGSLAPNRSRMMRAHNPGGLGTCHLFEEMVVGIEEERQLRAEAIHIEARPDARVT